MKLLVFCAFVAAANVVVNALATFKVARETQDVKLVRYESNNDGLGTYNFAYDLSDQSSRNEEGELKNAGTKNEFVAVRGSFSWMDPDGNIRNVDYIADENGYRPLIHSGLVGTPPPEVAALYNYEQNDFSSRKEEGELKNAGTDNEFVAVKGSYSWIDPNGVYYIAHYIADENGYQQTLEQGSTENSAVTTRNVLGDKITYELRKYALSLNASETAHLVLNLM
ncbi:hypothetical protein PYW08_014808 [Mythimna loreyi]|uniref:Uncharacterized protein n=1 Tax=Mythimna loreyi TaxID=667449 RepID=A0ACC2R3Y5_9NEOP|nr:hypothetical protein PYW08_014808 [Mythimna loreyi]